MFKRLLCYLIIGILSLSVITFASEGESIFGDISGEEITVSYEEVSLNIGTRFATKVPGKITKARIYTSVEEKGKYTVEIWNVIDSEIVAGPYEWDIKSGTVGWQEFELPEPVGIEAGVDYLIAIRNNDNSVHYSFIKEYFKVYSSSFFITQDDGGVFTTSSDAMPSNKNLISYPGFLRDIVFVPDENVVAPKQDDAIKELNTVYLSDLKLGSSYSFNSLLGIDAANMNEGLVVNTEEFSKGFAMYASSHAGDAYVEINIEDLGFKTFAAYVGIGDLLMSNNMNGTAIFMVEVDGVEVAKSSICKYGEDPVLLKADITGGKVLRLSVSNAGDGVDGDLAVWGKAVVSKSTEVDDIYKEVSTIATPVVTASPTPEKTSQVTASPEKKDENEKHLSADIIILIVLVAVSFVACIIVIVLRKKHR